MTRRTVSLSRLGLNSHWNAEDLDGVIEYHRELLEKWKKENGHSPRTPVKNIRGFLDSVQALHLYGYCFTDIGSMFGLSKQRVHQIFEEHGLKRVRGFPRYRFFNDKRNFFSSVPRKNLEEKTREIYEIRQEERYKEKRQTHIRTIRDFFNEKGRVPLAKELASILGYANVSSVACYWRVNRDGTKISYTMALDRLYIAAGFKERRIQGGDRRTFVTREIAA